MYATLNDSYQWNQLNAKGAVTNKVQDILTKGEEISLDRIPTAILQFKNKLKSSLSGRILEYINDGRIRLFYSPDIKVPVYLPFIVTQSAPNTYTGIVFLNVVEAERPSTPNGEIFMNARKLKVSLESCFISLCMRELGNSPKTRSTTLLRSGSKIYAGMLTECINRKHSIKLEPNVYNSLLFVFSRYYIGTMLGGKDVMEADALRNYCLYNCTNAEIVEMDKIIGQFETTDFANISTLIAKIKEIPQFNRRLNKLTLSNFMESYINMYNASALLGLEVFNYFLYNILSVNDSTYVNNYPVLKNIVGDDGKKIYADLVVAVSNL